MLGLFVILMCVLTGKFLYELFVYLLRKFRGDEKSNETISMILAVLSALGLGQLFIEYYH